MPRRPSRIEFLRVNARRLYRTDDMDTSREAAESIVPDIWIYLQRVWKYALQQGDDGFTDRELSDAMAHLIGSNSAQRTSTYRSRRSDWTKAGMIVDTGRRKVHPPGNRKHAVWRRALPHELE